MKEVTAMKHPRFGLWFGALSIVWLVTLVLVTRTTYGEQVKKGGNPIFDKATDKITRGQQVFRFDTFGDEAFWGGMLGLHQAIEGAALGGIGPGVSPKTALTVGLKVDIDALPSNLVGQLQRGEVNLNDPAVTLALFQLNAVVGVTGV